ncbi:HHL265Wp [Eremothecium sinecaudum]|uniref:Derlin n=1 Tax=Eremothecium sinecaudum TaxID=45286 RepID=A0A0X8HW53_9SACH|nr:HHL265Wp [Eremothecium sinecaudum]AMD22505.1 HHL265Wp [Eremothecium sinecaudum]
MTVTTQSSGGLMQVLRDIPTVTKGILCLLLLWCVNVHADFKILRVLTVSWYYRTHDYQFWKLFGLFIAFNYNTMQGFIMLYQIYRNSNSLEIEYFGGEVLDYVFFLGFTMTVTSILTAICVSYYHLAVYTLFPAFAGILLFMWSMANSNTMVNYVVLNLQAKYLPLINLFVYSLNGSVTEVVITVFGYVAAYIYCCLDTMTLGPLYGLINGERNYGFPTATTTHFRGRTLIMRLLGYENKSSSVRRGANSAGARAKPKSTANASSFKGEGRRLHDGKPVPPPRSIFFHSRNPASKGVQEITSSSHFSSAIASSRLVVVDFYATWCGPCKMLAPILEQYAAQYTTADFYKVDVDQHRSIASQHEISAMPTVVFFKKGKEVARIRGGNASAIKGLIETHA